MSNLRVAKLAIKNANLETLTRAVQTLANLLGMQVVNSVDIYGGRIVKVAVGLKGAALPSGIGFDIEEGQLVSKGDSWRYENEYSRVETLLRQTYGYEASKTALMTKGYMVQTPMVKVFGNKFQAVLEGVRSW